MKRIVNLAVTAMVMFIFISTVTAGGKQEAPAGGTEKVVTVDYTNFSGSGGNAKFLEQMKETFEKQNTGIRIKIKTVDFGNYFIQLQTKIASGSAPDSYELNYENFITYAKKNVLMDLGPLFKKSNFDTSMLNKNALNAFRADGKQYGLPESYSTVLLFYNKDLFDKAGASYPADDWKWADEQRAAEKIRALGKNIFGISHPIQFWEFYKVVQQNAGSLLSKDGTKFTVDTPQNVETLQFMVDRVLKSNVMPSEKQMAGMGDWDMFKSGRLGMIVTGIWAFNDFTKDCKFNWDIAVEPGNLNKATHFFANGLVINKDSKVAGAAFEWVKFMSASKEAARIRVDAGWELPASTYPEVMADYNSKTPPANRKAVFESLNYLVTPPVVEQMSEMTDILNLQLQAARDGDKTPAQALADAQKELEKKIKLK
ncbi:MAG: sugar ABC transporter substrate-binding protein [Spirochaetes bacterium]|nr:sugar ABC transporter substrate-binding protein [Spirochaetota bacterium]